MHKITFVSVGKINDMYDALYEWYNNSRGEDGLPRYDVKRVACSTIAAFPKTSLITYEEIIKTDDDGNVTKEVVEKENSDEENQQKKYKNCLHVFYEIREED